MTGSADHGAATTPAEVRETHVAVVFFVGDRAYKLKKPVELGFLDFRDVRARRSVCEREVALNRRFAPDVYLGLADVRLPAGGPPEPLVVMRRMPAERRLARLVRGGAPVREPLRAVARLLATVHAEAPRGQEIAAEGTRDALLARWEANLAEASELGGPGDPPPGLAEVSHRVRRYLAGREPLLAERVAAGRVVDGHGDLLAEDVFCLDDGVRVLDCLEFDDRLRYVDGLDDAAFLAMDLERLGATEAAGYFVDRYREFAADPAPASLYHHYVAYRAFVRAKVALVRAEQGGPGAADEGAALLDLALNHLRTSTVALVLVGGLPGTGKSTLSGALADRLGSTLLSSDRLRKELAGVPPDQPAPAGYGHGLYSPERTHDTYRTLLDRATTLLARGESVVLDASWTAAEHREAAARVADRAGAELVALRCEVPQETAAARLAVRAPGPSDADAEVAAAMAARQDPWPDAVTVDTSGPVPRAVDRALEAVRPEPAAADPARVKPYLEPG